MAEAPTNTEKSNKPKRCRFFTSKGGCKHGDKCTFDHTPKKPKRQTPLCRHWNTGECDHGVECRFRHDDDPNAGPARLAITPCSRCGEPGHLFYTCSNECNKCDTTNHVGRKCIQCNFCREWGHHCKSCPNYCTECEELTHNRRECPYIYKRSN